MKVSSEKGLKGIWVYIRRPGSHLTGILQTGREFQGTRKGFRHRKRDGERECLKGYKENGKKFKEHIKTGKCERFKEYKGD